MAKIKTTHRDIAEFLETAAKEQRCVFYSDVVAAHCDLPKQLHPWPQHPLCTMFDELDREDHRNEKPFRTAIVISKEKKMPGPGFFQTFGRLKAPKMSKAEHDAYWSAEVRDVFAYYR